VLGGGAQEAVEVCRAVGGRMRASEEEVLGLFTCFRPRSLSDEFEAGLV